MPSRIGQCRSRTSRSLFEAARWAASSYNEQPWRYIVATKENPGEFERLLSCLVEGNQPWAKEAPVLALGCAALKFAANDKPNAVALHDLGQASAALSVEATARGLFVHQMAGILPDRAHEALSNPRGRAAAYRRGDWISRKSRRAPRGVSQARSVTPATKTARRVCISPGQWGAAADLAKPGH